MSRSSSRCSLLGALFGKLMEDSGSVSAIAGFMTERLGPGRAIVTVVLAGALVTYGGVSLFVAVFVLAPMAQDLFRAAHIPNRLIPATVFLGTSTFTMSALPGTPAIQNAIPIRSSARHRWRRRVWASSPRPSWPVLACGGCAGPSRLPVAKERGLAQHSPAPPTPQPRTRRCASARRPLASLTPSRSDAGIRAARGRRSGWRHCRSSW